ncbi:MAG: glycosyltransferase family 4 protein [Caulobacteraceae bacterium]|nr:glycosyltransferase family 4 protein [Caulobacteraceae bacterium]
MKVLHALNYHRAAWGSDQAWEKTLALSRQSGLDVRVFSRDSRTLRGLGGRSTAFVSGIYAPESLRDFSRELQTFAPDVVHTHELYPLISPWILRRCRRAGVPVVHTCYDYRLTCPIATHVTGGEICRRCVGGHEHWAVLKNCRGHYAESVAYALRSAVARHFRLYIDNVDHFLVPTEFSRQWLSEQVGVSPGRMTVQPCVIALPPTPADPAAGSYVAFAGRFAPEKGVDLLIEAARAAGLPLRLAGNADTHPAIRPGDDVQCVVTRSAEELAQFYRGARLLVMPSLWEETFGVVAAEAMSHGVPVIAAAIGALAHTVVDQATGLLFEPRNGGALAAVMRQLWDDPELCRRLGAAGRQKVKTQFDEASHVRHLMDAYEAALAGAHRPAADRS